MRIAPRSYALVLSLLFVLGLARTADARGSKGRYVDKQHGFSIVLLRKWSQTPTQPGEEVEVAKFKEDRKRDFGEMSIYRFVDESALPESTPGEDGEEEAPAPAPRRIQPGMPRGGLELIDGYVKRLGNRIRQMAGMRGVKLDEGDVPTLPEPRELDFGPTTGELYIIHFEPVPRLRFPGSTLVAGIAKKGPEEYLVIYNLPRHEKGGKLNQVVGSVKSFRCPGDADVEADDREARGRVIGDEDELIDLEKRQMIKSKLVGTWKYIDTKHYIVIFNCEIDLARRIADKIEFMRSYAFEKVFPTVEPIEEAMVVRVCKEFDEYHHYGGPQGSGGYWSFMTDEFVLPKLPGGIDQTIGVLRHEGFHQYIYYCLLKHNPPVWFNEGYAEYFFTVADNSTPRSLRFEKRHPMRYGVIKSALGTDQVIPTEEFIHLTHQQYMQRADLCYAQGWAFATWLKNVTRNKRYREIPDIFFSELQQSYKAQKDSMPEGETPSIAEIAGGDSPITRQALQKAFEGIDLEELHADFLHDLKKKM